MDTIRETPSDNVSDSVPVEQGEVSHELDAGPMVVEGGVTDAGLDKTIPPEVELEPLVRPSKQQENAPLAELRFEPRTGSSKDSTFQDPNFAYALACGLQNYEDQEVLGQFLTPELRMKTFQGLVNVNLNLNLFCHFSYYIAFLYSRHDYFHRLPNVFFNLTIGTRISSKILGTRRKPRRLIWKNLRSRLWV